MRFHIVLIGGGRRTPLTGGDHGRPAVGAGVGNVFGAGIAVVVQNRYLHDQTSIAQLPLAGRCGSRAVGPAGRPAVRRGLTGAIYRIAAGREPIRALDVRETMRGYISAVTVAQRAPGA